MKQKKTKIGGIFMSLKEKNKIIEKSIEELETVNKSLEVAITSQDEKLNRI